MTLNDITKKLIWKNKGRYLIFGVSICFAIAMIGAYGVLLFSPVITDVLMTDGSTYMIALGMYGITVLGIIVFIFYANAIFIRFQIGEAGIFLSLGLPPKAVNKMQSSQLDQVFMFGGGLAGFILAVPFSFVVWSLLTLFLSYTNHVFMVGWEGLGIMGGLWLLLWGTLRLKNAIALSRRDIIKILHSSSESEEVRGSHPALGMAGIVAIPIGLLLFNLTAVMDGMKSISLFFLGFSLVGIYLLTAQITAVGSLVKRFFAKKYQNNILFYNLVRQKGNQYTLSLFVSSLLIAVTVFSICFNGSSFLELYYQVKEDPYDYAVLLGNSQKPLHEHKIRSMAKNSDILITDWKSLDLLLLGREHQYADSSKNEWSTEFAIRESDFKNLTGMEWSVPEDGFIYFEDSDDATFQTFAEEQGRFYNPTTHEEFTLKKTDLISKSNVLNNSAQISLLLILNDKTFEKISGSLNGAYQFNYYLFNGNNPENSRTFQQKLLAEVVALSDGKIFDSYQQEAIKDKIEGYSDSFMPYKGNELYAARQWDFYPYAKQTQIDVQLEAGAVYLLLIFFIAIISFVSASMIMGLKIAGTILQDQASYQRAMYLGLKEKDLKKIIRKQIGLVYFFPTICGCMTASYMVNRFMAVSSVTHIYEITLVAVGLSFIVFLIQCVVFFFLQKKLVSSTSKMIYESR